MVFVKKIKFQFELSNLLLFRKRDGNNKICLSVRVSVCQVFSEISANRVYGITLLEVVWCRVESRRTVIGNYITHDENTQSTANNV